MTAFVLDDHLRDRLAEMLPGELRPLFDERFVGSCVLFEEYVHRLAIRVVREAGIEAAARAPGTAAEVAARAGLDPARAAIPVAWLLSMLAARGLATRQAEDAPAVPGPLPAPDPAEVAEAQQRLDPAALPSYRIAALAADLYPAVLAGGVRGEEALFGPEHGAAWFDYFSNDNPLYAISNRVGAAAAAQALRGDGGAVLEIGGGLGSGAAALLERCAAAGRPGAVGAYRFTEVAPSFLRRGQRSLSGKFPGVALSFARLDMDRPFAEAGIEAGAFTLVYGVNTLHVARDLEFTLSEVRRALAPGGALVLSECVRPFPGRPVYVEFVFNLLEAFRSPRLVEPWRPNGGFLTPEQWTLALEANGFREVRTYPDVARLREAFPSFVAGAITGLRP